MTMKDYAELLKGVMQMQIDYVMDEAGSGACETEYLAGYYEGIKKGIEIAMEKIDASMFLAEKYS